MTPKDLQTLNRQLVFPKHNSEFEGLRLGLNKRKCLRVSLLMNVKQSERYFSISILKVG